MIILGLDIGTSSVKAAVLDQASGEPLEPLVKVPYEIDHPTPDAAEIPPARLKEATWTAARKAVAKFSHPEEIGGVGMSCLMPALVLLDSANEPLAPIWIHLDRRSRGLARKVISEVGDEFLNTCGNRPLPGGMSALCYRQLIDENSSIQPRIAHYLHANGWLGFLMTGERAFDYANASFTGLYETMGNRDWSDRWIHYFGVNRSWLPPVVCGSTTLGSLRSDVAGEWGIPAGLPVKLGTADTSSGMLSARMTSRDLYVTVGTTTVLGRFVEHPQPDPRRLTRMFGVGPAVIYAAHNPVGGSALPWLMELCFYEYLTSSAKVDEFYANVVREAANRTTEVLLDPPFLGGDRLEIEPRRAAFRNLTLAANRMDLLTALLQAMREGHRNAFNALDWDRASIDRIFLTGGGKEVLQMILPELESANIHLIEDGALKGTARLFD